MKKYFTLFVLFVSFVVNLRAGQYTSAVIDTNTWLFTPTNILDSNAVNIAAALQRKGYLTGTNASQTNFYDETQIQTNGAGKVHIYQVAFSNLSGTISNANLPSAVATVASNNAGNLTNIPAASLTGTIPVLNLPAAVATVSSNNAGSLTNLQAANLTGTLPRATLPAVVLTNAPSFVAATNGNGATITNLNAANLAGTLDDARLSTNVPLINSGGVVFNNEPGFWDQGAGLIFFSNNSGQLENMDFSLDEIDFLGGIPFSFDDGVIASYFSGNGANLNHLATGSFVGQINPTNATNFVQLNGTNVMTGYTQSSQFTGTNYLLGTWNVPGVYKTIVAGENLLDVGTNTYITLNQTGSPGAFSITGMNGKNDGREVTIVNPTGQPMTIRNLSGLVDLTNQITTAQSGDIVMSNNPAVFRSHYDFNTRTWVFTGFNALSFGVVSLGGGVATAGGVGTNNYFTNLATSGQSATNLTIVSGNGSGLTNINRNNLVNSYIGGIPVLTPTKGIKILSLTMLNTNSSKFLVVFAYTNAANAQTNLFTVTYAVAPATTPWPILSPEGTNSVALVYNGGGFTVVNETNTGFIVAEDIETSVSPGSPTTNLGLIIDASQ